MSPGARAERAAAAPRALPASDVLISRIGWLIRLRWTAVLVSLLFIEIANETLPLDLQLQPLRLLVVALALYNLGAWLVWRRRGRRAVQVIANAPTPHKEPPHGQHVRLRGWADGGALLLPRSPAAVPYYDDEAAAAAAFAFAQIVIDLLLLAAMLHFSGGVENPLWAFAVFHVIFASVLLSPPATFVVATLGTALLGIVVFGELNGWLQHYPLSDYWRSAAYLQPHLVQAYWVVQGITLFVAAYLASSIAGRLRRREADVLVLSQHLEHEADRLQAAYRELSIAEKAKSQYMRKVAHELRQPLGTVKTALTYALQSSDTMAPRVRDMITRAERRAGELADMTQELLTLSRARGGAAAVELTPIELAQLAGPVLQEMHARAAEKNISLCFEAQMGLPPLRGDPDGLADLLTNLLGNAIRYTPDGGRVVFRAVQEQDELVLEVEDTGIGIPRQDQARIFDEFYRTPAARNITAQGSGLGLAIVKAVVEQHHGSIAVQSEEGKGARFRVRLPIDTSTPAVSA